MARNRQISTFFPSLAYLQLLRGWEVPFWSFKNKFQIKQFQSKYIRKMETQCNTRLKMFFRFVGSVSPLINSQSFTLFQAKYYIKEFKLEEIDQTMAKSIYSGIVTRNKKSNSNKNELNWLENELRMFVWTLLYYSHSQHVEIQNFTDGEWDFFLTLFPNKRRILFEYQAYNLLKHHNQYKKWDLEEDELFEQLVKKDEYRLRWSDLGKSLFIESDRKFFRTPKQCRERWLNHLDPSKMKKCWSQEQDFLLISNVHQFGKKWASISKKLQNRRNEHSIKNRFKSLITKESKFFLNPVSEKQIVNSLYHKLLQTKTKSHSGQDSSMKIYDALQQNSKQLGQNDHFMADEERGEASLYDFCDQSEHFLKHQSASNQMLGNPSLIHIDNKNELTKEKPIFQFSKIPVPELKHFENTTVYSWDQSELQKRIRADLFLQEDPFEMLKSFFYKSSLVQQ